MSTETLRLQKARATEEGLAFETPGGLTRALRDGCFLLAVPPGFDTTPGVTLCREFFRPVEQGGESTRAYRGFRDLDGVYFDREHFQTEHVLIDGPGRERHFPPELRRMAEHMHELARHVLRTVLTELGVARELWSEVTGGAVDGRGTEWFAANHYRSERDRLGCAPHKDTGFVTVLYIEEGGLEAATGGSWTPVDPVPGCFVVNFGGAFELLTSGLDRPVRALLHRVRQCAPRPESADRFSFAAFVNPPPTGDLYRVGADGTATVARSTEDFLRDFNERTWGDGYADFGIAPPEPAGVAEDGVRA
ncbi:hypothetical protein BLA24_33490 [Streptomyces cinnamoneus]|uniref:BcmC n=1 Tax=Streptomyces cinnamoneus TaxID=53446 RepID=A0A2G1XAR5_STRCJ|nr:2OG-Fe(II) oxygenase family protein [Streptomyces cinnamoneus]AXQ04974.1 BcmC [Streptomyces cinnamoneus]PHQ48316.1 hypothetical protein BLA24_33490 [Streptomyces cinnamoneus]PPT15947.1 2OG-Fe(II) oxygenase [Streptomyces cinnamoneus]